MSATIVNQWNPIAPCAAPQTTLPPLELNVATSLVYVATQGQTDFPLSTPDRFGEQIVLSPENAVEVFRNGSRLAPDDGTGMGGYTLPSSNTVTLLWPAGAGEVIVIDVYSSSAEPTGLTGVAKIVTEPVAVTAPNTLAPLHQVPNGQMLILFVNGQAFFSVGPQAGFSVSGQALAWTSSLFSLHPGDAVIAVYTSQ